MKLSNHETIIDKEKYLEVNKATANHYWNKSRRIAKPYYLRVKQYEKSKQKES